MKFIDSTEIHVAAGKGGDGMLSFRAARNLPKLGPDGGNGGLGGDVVLIAQKGMNTLSTLRYRQVYQAEDGVKGGTNDKTGRCGDALQIAVPLGTVVFDSETDERLGELLGPGDELLVAKGGSRGYGNNHYTSSTNRAPQQWTQGKKGERKTLRLELKLLADIGLAGLPNAGKSTLLSRVSAARPKIADYPFTTLVPQLGVVDLFEFDVDASFVVADIPGLIEGASEGRGLGHDFLRHIERTRVIAFVIDPFNPDGSTVLETFELLHRELLQYKDSLGHKKFVVVLNKMDLLHPENEADVQKAQTEFAKRNIECLSISAVAGLGIKDLKLRFYELTRETNISDEP